MSSSSMISSFEVLWSAGRIRGSVGDTFPMIGEGKLFAIGSTRVAVSAIVCTTEGCIDSISYPYYLGLFLVRLVVLVRVWGNDVVGIEGDDKRVSWCVFVGGGAINTSPVIISCSGAVSGISDSVWGAKLFGTLGMRTRIARAMLDLFEDTPLPVSRFLCFIFRSPFCMRVHSLMWLRILASVVFSCVRGPRRFM